MATIKSYTDISQSKKLAEILPLESADMMYQQYETVIGDDYGYDYRIQPFFSSDIDGIPCWSLAALLGVLPKGYSLGRRTNGKYYVCMTYTKHNMSEFDNPVDACYDMILKLHQLNLL